MADNDSTTLTVELPDLTTRQRRLTHDLLSAMDRGHVYRSGGGRVLRDVPGRGGSYPVKKDDLANLTEWGWVTEDSEGHFPLTDTGRAAKAALAPVTT